jgi:RNA polymerase sigma factor (sigma-70 family)
MAPSSRQPSISRDERRSFRDSVLRHSARTFDTVAGHATVENAPGASKSLNRIPLLTREETDQLLAETVELRRIRSLDNEIAAWTTSPSTTSSLAASTSTSSIHFWPLSQQQRLSQVAGYGDDVQALNEAMERGQHARETLVTRNMGLVRAVVNDVLGGRHRRIQNLSMEDLWQEGAIGLARAVDGWNPEIGGVFSTYAYYWIRGSVLRCISNQDELVRVPEHVNMAVRKLNQAQFNSGFILDEEEEDDYGYFSAHPQQGFKSAEELAKETGLTHRQVEEAMKVRQRRKVGVLSFEAWMQQGRNFETDLMSSSPSSMSVDNDSLQLSMETVEYLRDTLSRYLRPKEMEALSWRYGLRTTEGASKNRSYKMAKDAPVPGKWGEAMSFVEVGKQMKVSAEYCRRLCHGAIGKLRRAAEEGIISPSLLFQT